MTTTKRTRSAVPGNVRQVRPGVWRVQVYRGLIDGKPKYRSETIHGTRHDAERHRAFMLTEETYEVTEESQTLGEVYRLWLAQGREHWSPSTNLTHQWILDRLEGLTEVPVGSLTPAAIDAHYDKLRASVASSTVRRIHNGLRSCLSWAEERGLIDSNPARRVKVRVPKAQVQAPSAAEVQALLAEAESLSPLHALLIRLAAATGARRGELLALKWGDVRDGQVVIQRTVAKSDGSCVVKDFTKTGRSRVVAVDEETMSRLEALRGPESAFVFSRDGSTPWYPDEASRTYRKLVKAAGVSVGSFHGLRHFHITELLRSGMPVHHVARRVGHANPAVTLQTYAHAVPADDDLLAATMGSLLG